MLGSYVEAASIGKNNGAAPQKIIQSQKLATSRREVLFSNILR